MKNFILPGFLGAFFLLSTPALSIAAQFSESGDAAIVIREGEHGSSEVYKRETKFVEDFYHEFDKAKLYKVVSETNYSLAYEGIEQVSTVTAYNVQEGPSYGEVLWSNKYNGGDFDLFSEELLKVTVAGCCAAPNEDYLIRKDNGAVVTMTHGDSSYILQVPNAQIGLRYIGTTYAEDAAEYKDGLSYIGTVIYFSKDNIISRAHVYADLPEDWGTEITELEITGENISVYERTVDLWGSDGEKDTTKAFSGVSLSGKLYYNNQVENFEIVISGDRIDAGKSIKSQGLHLEIL